MQIHSGSFRNHNAQLFARFGRDKGADIPRRTESRPAWLLPTLRTARYRDACKTRSRLSHYGLAGWDLHP